MQVNYSNDRRELVLLKGEAFFDVAKDPEHPFVVKADDKVVEIRRLEDAPEMGGESVVDEGRSHYPIDQATFVRALDTGQCLLSRAILCMISSLQYFIREVM